MMDIEAKARELCAAPAGCAFLLMVEESGQPPAVVAEPIIATQIAAIAVDEVSPWFPAHERVVALALDHGPRLLDLARDILAQPAAEAWFGPLDRRAQIWAASPDSAESVPAPRDPNRPLLWWERYAQKPDWGLWTSTALDAAGTTSFFAGVEAGTGDLAADFAPPFARYALRIASMARICEIDGPAAWRQLCLRYPASGEDGRLVPDWPRVAHDWDGVHLTLGGLLTAEQVRIAGAPGWTEHAAWDTEQAVWLREVFDRAERLPDLTALPEPPDWIGAPRALWIKPRLDTWPWLVSLIPDSTQ